MTHSMHRCRRVEDEVLVFTCVRASVFSNSRTAAAVIHNLYAAGRTGVTGSSCGLRRVPERTATRADQTCQCSMEMAAAEEHRQKKA